MLEYTTEELISKYINIGLNKQQAIKAALIDVNNSKSLEKKLSIIYNNNSIEIFDNLFLIKKELETLLTQTQQND
jgi:hypothetical protein